MKKVITAIVITAIILTLAGCDTPNDAGHTNVANTPLPGTGTGGLLGNSSGLTYGSSTLTAPTGRVATYVIAASDATAIEKAQADYVCTGTSSLSASIANGTGTISSPGAWASGTSKNVTGAGNFTVTLAVGQTAIATSGTATLVGYPIGTSLPLVAGVNTLDTGATTGTIYISGMGDETQINAAINAISGGLVELSSGHFYTSSPIYLKKNVSIQGCLGGGATYIKLVNNSNCNTIEYNQTTFGANFITISNFTLDGNGTHQTSGNGIYLTYTAPATAVMDVVIERIFVVSAKVNGIYIIKAWGIRINNCNSESNGGAAYYIAGGSQSYITNDYASVSSNGFWLNGTDLMVSNCHANVNTTNGFIGSFNMSELVNCYSQQNANGYDLTLTSTSLTNCESYLNTAKGFFLSGGTNATFTNCITYDDLRGFFTDGSCNKFSFIGCQARRNTILDYPFGFANLHDSVIEGCIANTIGTTGACAMSISSTSNNISVIDCQFSGFTTKISDSSTAKISNLIINNNGYIASGEIRTISGTITGTASDNAALMLSIDNPFGQAVRVLDVQVEITANASASATMDAGIGSSATADYTTMIAALPINPGTSYPYFYSATKTATYGQMAAISGINWATGSGNRYLNFYNPSSNASGTVFRATYTITVMGN